MSCNWQCICYQAMEDLDDMLGYWQFFLSGIVSEYASGLVGL